MTDSVPVACQLLSLENVYPPAYQLGRYPLISSLFGFFFLPSFFFFSFSAYLLLSLCVYKYFITVFPLISFRIPVCIFTISSLLRSCSFISLLPFSFFLPITCRPCVSLLVLDLIFSRHWFLDAALDMFKRLTSPDQIVEVRYTSSLYHYIASIFMISKL